MDHTVVLTDEHIEELVGILGEQIEVAEDAGIDTSVMQELYDIFVSKMNLFSLDRVGE